ncbi:MAG: 2-hydroxychromene-2-carboxylate isomerase [Rhodospirillales bacterium]|nr:2-hydroxychromene-2-carboxylate isomerase [Rhodospirillales bacterium]
MPAPIQFWFDFSSPYAYFAALRIDGIGVRHGRAVEWLPFMLGAAFKSTGMAPLVQQPLRGDYARRDWDRIARRMGVPFVLRKDFPMVALAGSRAVYWLDSQDGELARQAAKRLFHAYFGEGRDMTEAEAVAAELAALGVDRDALLAAVAAPEWKARLKDKTAEAVASGVFGSPFTMVDGEPFWGHDRLDEVERWLESGGW